MKYVRFPDLIIFEDEDIIIINKPPHFASLDERGVESMNILKMARDYHADSQLCHRLDKETSGCLIIAKNPDTYRDISMLFEHRKVYKIYHAIVSGNVSFEEKMIDLPIAQTPKAKVKIDSEGKDAVTILNTAKHYRHFSLIECMPITGRMHQIRIHLASQNAPISGDTLYGGEEPMLSDLKRKYKLGKWVNEEPMMKRVALHAYRIRFERNEKQFDVSAPYPKDFAVFVKLLEKYDSL